MSNLLKLPKSFYARNKVVQVARDLLGKTIYTNIKGELTSGIITETEAYCGASDKACHAYNKRTPRTEIMYQQGGLAYVYLCYGIHHLFNIVTNKKDNADAVLIRAIEPIEGIDIMMKRRNMRKIETRLTAGPGSMSKALGITTELYGMDLASDVVWISEGIKVDRNKIIASKRIGVDYAGEDALLPWRFTIEGSKWISK